MNQADVPLMLRLKAEAGWNQTEADVHRFLAMEPAGCFVAEFAGQGVGTVTTCRFDGTVGWIAMLLVDSTVRGQGVGTRLMRHAIDWLDQQGVVSQRLDATAEGRPIYEKLGFGQQFTVTRWKGTAQPLTSLTETVENFDEHKIASLLELDRTCVGVDRGKLLRRLAQESDVTARIVHGADRDELVGYLITRPGALARQIGPGVARTEAAGRALFMDALHRCRGQPVMLDVPDDNSVAKATVEEAGLSPARQFIRMGRGDPACEEIKQLWLSSGPEKG